MELFILALAGIAGVAALLAPAAPLPTEAEFKKAKDKLATSPDDPDANTVVGKYLAFVTGDYAAAMPYLSKSGNKTLKTLADHERDPVRTGTAQKRVGMGDEWVNAAKNFPGLARIFYDRASAWYSAAWPLLKNDPTFGDPLRARALQLSASRPPGAPNRPIPIGWKTEGGAPVLDGTIARTGSYSAKLTSVSFVKSDPIPVAGNRIDYSAFFRSEDTYDVTDQLILDWLDKDVRFIRATGLPVPLDTPFWTFVSGTAQAPEGAAFVQLTIALRSKRGTLWVDDASLKVDGKEMIKNPSFEEK
jgi:hypothetical protein